MILKIMINARSFTTVTEEAPRALLKSSAVTKQKRRWMDLNVAGGGLRLVSKWLGGNMQGTTRVG